MRAIVSAAVLILLVSCTTSQSGPACENRVNRSVLIRKVAVEQIRSGRCIVAEINTLEVM